MAVEKYCGVRQALLIEPQPHRVKELEKRFRGSRFIIKECAITDVDAFMDMHILNWDYSSSLLRVKPEIAGFGKVLDLNVREIIRVPVRTLDSVLAEAGWDNEIDLLKSRRSTGGASCSERCKADPYANAYDLG